MSAISSATTVRQFPVGTWQVESGNLATFVVSNFGFKKVRGAVPIRECRVEIDRDGQLVSCRAALDLAAIDTGNRRRDLDLAKPKLLDLDQYPVMTFDSVASGDLVAGTLSAQGHSIPVEITVELPDVAQRYLSVRISGEFDRADLGIKAPSFMIGRRVKVEFSARFARV